MARPGGNLTGINFFVGELAAKRLELLRELVPGAARVTLLLDRAVGQMNEATLGDVEAAARPKELKIEVLNVQESREITARAGLAKRFDGCELSRTMNVNTGPPRDQFGQKLKDMIRGTNDRQPNLDL